MKILIVDDHADSAEVLAFALRFHGHEVTLATGVAEAIARYDGGCCEMMVCDLRLPDGDGWDLMRTLSSRHKLTGIAVSGLGYAADIERSRQAGFAAHLTKPLDIDTLVHTIESLRPCA
jgi:CheY-like chemotaxis protein